jgi:hypothetical protein
MISLRPVPAQGSPFAGHRTVAEVDAAFDAAAHSQRRPAVFVPRVEVRGERSSMPPVPCFRCGSRGWCGHGGRVA